jgi:hypothetical protein
MTKHTFLQRDKREYPIVGDLVRSGHTPDFINIVLEVTEPKKDHVWGNLYVGVRSVRYGCTNKGDFKLLDGMRSRWIKYRLEEGSFGYQWAVVDEYVQLDNSKLKQTILWAMKDVDTTYHPPELQEGDIDELS